MKGPLLLYYLKLNCLIFSTGLNSSLIIFIWTHTVNCRYALDRLRVHMNIILLAMWRNIVVYSRSISLIRFNSIWPTRV